MQIMGGAVQSLYTSYMGMAKHGPTATNLHFKCMRPHEYVNEANDDEVSKPAHSLSIPVPRQKRKTFKIIAYRHGTMY